MDGDSVPPVQIPWGNMRIREAVVSGRFYGGDPAACRAELHRLLSGTGGSEGVDGPVLAGLVPHAGWAYSGRVAARVFAFLASSRQPDVIFYKAERINAYKEANPDWKLKL